MNRLLLSALFGGYKDFKTLLIQNGIDENDIMEDWYDYIFVRYGSIRTKYKFYKEVNIDIVFRWKKLIRQWKNIEEIQTQFSIKDTLIGKLENERKDYGTNEVGEEIVDYQVLGKDKTITTSTQSINKNTIINGLELFADTTIGLLENFIREVQNVSPY